MDTRAFFKRLDNIPDIPTLPAVAIKVNKMLQDPDTSIKELSTVIGKDQAMATKILKLVNSSFCGFRSETNNIPHAVIMLGFNTIRDAVISVSIIKAFSGEKSLQGFEITDFWKHSIAVAMTSRCLSEQSRLDTPNDCFVAGLLHDIGKVILSQHFREFFDQVWRSAEKDNLSFYQAEERLLPVSHAQIGGYLTKKWQFPRSLTETITYHHAIRKTVSNLNQLLIVHAADNIVNNYKIDSGARHAFSHIDPEAKAVLFSQVETVSDWFPEVASEIDSACEFFLNEE